MKKIYFAIFILFSVSLSGCGGGDEEKGPFYINQKAPVEFYKGFIYKVNGSCSDQEKMTFGYIGPKTLLSGVPIGTLPDGRDVKALLEVYLSENGIYEAEYSEVVQIQKDVIETLFSKDIKGHWAIEKRDLVISGVGRFMGQPTMRGQDMNFQFIHPVNNPGTQGKVLPLSFIESKEGKKDIKSYCTEANKVKNL